MSLDYEMNGIYPVPIYFTKLKKFTDMELKVIRLMENQSAKNMGNSRSDDTFVLKSKHFENIKKQLMSHVKQYFDKVISTSDKIVPYITQSWINYTREGEYHHSHAHPNVLSKEIPKSEEDFQLFESLQINPIERIHHTFDGQGQL